MSRDLLRELAAAICLLIVVFGGSQAQVSNPGQFTKPRIVEPNRPPPRPDTAVPADVDQRTEYIARAICRARGVDPDFEGPPFPPGPVWRMFVPEAREIIAAYDALRRIEREHRNEQ